MRADGRGRDGDRIAIVRVFDLGQLFDDLRLSDQVTEANTGQTIRLAQCPRDNHIGQLTYEVNTRVFGKVGIGLIDDERARK